MDDNLVIYDEFVARHEAAYTGFVKYYTLKNPPPDRQEIHRDFVSTLIIIALAIVMLASVIVSSSRTIDEFGGGQIGTIAFVMVEGGIMAYAFFRARRTASTERLEKTVRWATIGLVLTFIVGLGANIDAELRHKNLNLPEWVFIGVNLLVGISAPTLAFISSDVLAIELMATDIRNRQSDKEHRIATSEWKEGLNRSWQSQQRNWGVSKIEIVQPNVQSVQLDSGQHGQGYKRESRAALIVREYLSKNPSDLSIPVRELAEKIGVSKSTVANVIRSMRDE